MSRGIPFSIGTLALRERSMEHRRFLAHPEAHRPFAGGDLLQRIGGRTAVGLLIDRLYDRIGTDYFSKMSGDFIPLRGYIPDRGTRNGPSLSRHKNRAYTFL